MKDVPICYGDYGRYPLCKYCPFRIECLNISPVLEIEEDKEKQLEVTRWIKK